MSENRLLQIIVMENAAEESKSFVHLEISDIEFAKRFYYFLAFSVDGSVPVRSGISDLSRHPAFEYFSFFRQKFNWF